MSSRRNRAKAVVVAQLVERSLPNQRSAVRIQSLAKKLSIFWTFVYCQLCLEKTKIKKKRPGKAHFLKKNRAKANIFYFQGLYRFVQRSDPVVHLLLLKCSLTRWTSPPFSFPREGTEVTASSTYLMLVPLASFHTGSERSHDIHCRWTDSNNSFCSWKTVWWRPPVGLGRSCFNLSLSLT